MSVVVVYDDRATVITGAVADGEDLWLSPDDLKRHTGWELKPQGACINNTCVPIPATRSPEFFRESGNGFNLAALGRHIGQHIVHDADRTVWVFGQPSVERRSGLQSLAAPDFELPALDGRLHRLSDYRGNKVLLFAWASW